MTTERHRAAVHTVERRGSAFPAALAAIALMLGAAAYGSNATEPSAPSDWRFGAPPNVLISVGGWHFDNPGTNARITDAVFSTTEYYSKHSIHEDSGIL